MLFRAWDKVLNKYNYSAQLDCYGEVNEYNFNGAAYYPMYEENNDRFEVDHCIIEREGKEVFINDIVKVSSYSTKEEFVIGRIVFYKWSYVLELTDNSYFFLEDITPEGIEVLGNIRENPELLNTKSLSK